MSARRALQVDGKGARCPLARHVAPQIRTALLSHLVLFSADLVRQCSELARLHTCLHTCIQTN